VRDHDECFEWIILVVKEGIGCCDERMLK
jgi:hypothetical protein